MSGETVVYVHGLWATAAESLWFRRRLSREFRLETYRYASVASSMAEVTDGLASFVAALAPQTLHLVGHSLGGLVIQRFLERHPDPPWGRVVFLGVPAAGSVLARTVARLRWGGAVLGRCVAEELLVERERRWSVPRPLGIIAGTRPLGLVPLIARIVQPRGAADVASVPGSAGLEADASDGTVAVSETHLPGATDHITVRASHLGLLLSQRVAYETSLFLREGHFALSRPFPGANRARSS